MSKPAEPKVVGNGKQKSHQCITRSNSERSCSHFLSLIPGLANPGSKETGTCIDHWFTAHAASWLTLFKLQEVLTFSWHHNWVFRRPFHHSTQLLQGDGAHVKTGKFHEHEPLFIRCQTRSLAMLCGILWWCVRHSLSPHSGDFCSSIVGKGEKPVSSVSAYFSKNQVPKEVGLCNSPTPNGWLIFLENGAILRPHGWYLL